MRTSYNSIKANIKRNMILDRLIGKGITKSRDGQSIYLLSDEELKHELVLSEYRKVDIESGLNKWF